ncbi:hypothetical protein K7X08_031927 [Anisodus acutangulus]|uniref:ABC transporter domain-containing protein n=1 Tax=Anisodus acutangulus TaxID=402998 RepID=A0A9Q1MM14_9SOLA|nr:hypothetical protein K7X08_031927 [Anisodus acutangulus]
MRPSLDGKNTHMLFPVFNSGEEKRVSEVGQEEELNYVKSNGGAFLTWNDLWVTVPTRKSGSSSKNILEGVTGYARPSELLAVMGPSVCAKSTLLDALAGRLDFSTRHSGDILINGHKQKLSYGTSVRKSSSSN